MNSPPEPSLTVGVERSGYCFQTRWPEFLRARGACVKEIDLRAADWLNQVRGCHGVMWHWWHRPDDKQIAGPILRIIECDLGIPVFPSLSTCWHFDNKIAQAYLLRAHGLPSAKTRIFWRKDEALVWADSATYPVVAKLSGGAGSSNVSLMRSANEARRHIRRMFSASGALRMGGHPAGIGRAKRLLRELLYFLFRCAQVPAYVFRRRYPPLDRIYWMPEKNYALFQEFISGNEGDTRITVIGHRAFGFRRLNRPGDFRASGSGRIDHDPAGIDLRCVRLAFDAAHALGTAQSCAFDFLFCPSSAEPVITEFSYGFADWAVAKCPGHWDPDLRWHAGSMWPEEAQVSDFLDQLRRRQGP